MIRDGSFSESFADVKYSQIKIICFAYQHKKVIKTCLNIRFKDMCSMLRCQFNLLFVCMAAFCFTQDDSAIVWPSSGGAQSLL